MSLQALVGRPLRRTIPMAIMAEKLRAYLLLPVSVALIVGVLLMLAAVAGGAFESVYAPEDSLKGFLMIVPSVVKSIPRVGRVRDVTLYTSSGDGPKPPADGISYYTDASPDVVLRDVRAYFLSEGFSPSHDDWSALTKGSDRVSIGIDRENQATQLVVTVFHID